jgi:hypothetical protein
MSTATARKMEPTEPEDILADLGAGEREFLRGIEETARQLDEAGVFQWSPERRALYGEDDDPMREIEDLERGRHPLLARARARFALR